jgi:hypothetical protein
MRRARYALAIAGTILTAVGSTGCWAVHSRESDIDRTPVVNTGAGASIIYPGQTAPPHPGNYHPREAGYGQGVTTAPQQPAGSNAGGGASPYGASTAPPPATGAAAHLPPGAVGSAAAQPPPEYASRSTSGSGNGTGQRGAGITMIGGAETDQTRHVEINEEPKWLKYLGLPFAVIAAPFKYGADKAAGEPEPAPEVPRLHDQPRPEIRNAPAVTDYETTQLRDMERELARREQPQAAAYGAPPDSGRPSPGRSSFADELAALRQRTQPTSPSQQLTAPTRTQAPVVARAPTSAPGSTSAPTPAPAPRSAPTTPRAAAGEVDRDGDGRTDHWIEREGGAIVREHFDEDFDSRPDRTLTYDAARHEVVRIDEDSDFDGRMDSWTAFRSGRVVGRRVDGNADGHVDTWSYYHDGVITRLERDANGDGFRDHVAYYHEGRLAREERDDDGDGRTDLVKFFDDGERVERVEEDADGDGEMDVISHYEGGRLTRREVLDASVLGLGRPTPSTGSEVN